MTDPSPKALFRFSVLGALLHRELARGELQQEILRLAARDYDIPGSTRTRIGAKTLEGWYYAYRREGLAGLEPKPRQDRGVSRIEPVIQEAILAAKRENPGRSIRQLLALMEDSGRVARGALSRSAIHRLLQAHALSRPTGAASEAVERRAYVAEYAGDLWYGDVMHGPKLLINGRWRKGYVVSLMDDASRLITHSAFALAEGALQIEGVLQQAILKRGLPKKLVVDNGAAYRAQTLQAVCARLGIHLVYCRPYAPEGKGKLERWHRTLRGQFISEVDWGSGLSLEDANARLWAWIEQVYHQKPHGGLQEGQTPLARYRQDLPRIRTLGPLAAQIDALFYHRIERLVRRDGTVAYQNRRFEVPYALVGRKVRLVVDPHRKRVLGVEDDQGHPLGEATELDAQANLHRRRVRAVASDADGKAQSAGTPNPVDLAMERYYGEASGDTERATENPIGRHAGEEDAS